MNITHTQYQQLTDNGSFNIVKDNVFISVSRIVNRSTEIIRVDYKHIQDAEFIMQPAQELQVGGT